MPDEPIPEGADLGRGVPLIVYGMECLVICSHHDKPLALTTLEDS